MPHCAVCKKPPESLDLKIEDDPAARESGLFVPTGAVRVLVKCHGQEWRMLLRKGQPLPAAFFAPLTEADEREAISRATAIECGPFTSAQIDDVDGNRISICHVSGDEAMRIFIARSAT